MSWRELYLGGQTDSRIQFYNDNPNMKKKLSNYFKAFYSEQGVFLLYDSESTAFYLY